MVLIEFALIIPYLSYIFAPTFAKPPKGGHKSQWRRVFGFGATFTFMVYSSHKPKEIIMPGEMIDKVPGFEGSTDTGPRAEAGTSIPIDPETLSPGAKELIKQRTEAMARAGEAIISAGEATEAQRAANAKPEVPREDLIHEVPTAGSTDSAADSDERPEA